MADPTISVIVKSYQRPWLLRVCLESIREFWPRDRYEYEVVIADDGTSPELWNEFVTRHYGLYDVAVHSRAGEAKWPLCRAGRFGEVVPTCGKTWNDAFAASRGDIIFLIEDDSYLTRPMSPEACAQALRKAAEVHINVMCLIGLQERVDMDVHGIRDADRMKRGRRPTVFLDGMELPRCPNHHVTPLGQETTEGVPQRADGDPSAGGCAWNVLRSMRCAVCGWSAVGDEAVHAALSVRRRETFLLLTHPVWPWSFDGIFYRRADWEQIGPWPESTATGPMEWFVQQRLRALGWLGPAGDDPDSPGRRYGLAERPFCRFDSQTSVRTDHPSTYLGRFRHVDACNAAWLSEAFSPTFADVRDGRCVWTRGTYSATGLPQGIRLADPMQLHYPRHLRQVEFVTGHELKGELAGAEADAYWLAYANGIAARYGEAPYETVPEGLRSA